MSDDDLRAKLTEAYMEREDCERVVDDRFTSYCVTHHSGWLHDVDACAHADATVTHALLPVVRAALVEAKKEALHEYAEALHANTSPDGIWDKSDYVSDIREWADGTPSEDA